MKSGGRINRRFINVAMLAAGQAGGDDSYWLTHDDNL
jgi:hypothetical protein